MEELKRSHRSSYEPWTPAEDNPLAELHMLIGSNWKAMAKSFPNLTDCQIKNRWHTFLKQREWQKIDHLEWQLKLRRNACEHHPSFWRGHEKIGRRLREPSENWERIIAQMSGHYPILN
jgi:hypothetical protein